MMFAQGLRAELGPHGVTVTLVYPGFVDTAMSTAFPFPKTPPQQIAACALDGVAGGQVNVFPDPFARLVEDAIAQRGDRILSAPHGLLAELVTAFLAAPGRPAAVRREV
jgi:NAD(P)-dependent dehydrogenase (short-subunit alcohol dehydrogenase family)